MADFVQMQKDRMQRMEKFYRFALTSEPGFHRVEIESQLSVLSKLTDRYNRQITEALPSSPVSLFA